MARIHRAFGLTTWGAMTLTVIFGTIQYYNLYGFFDSRDSNPCGDMSRRTIGLSDTCIGTPVLHLTSALVTAAAPQGSPPR